MKQLLTWIQIPFQKKFIKFFVVSRNIESIIDWKVIFEMPY